MTLRERNLLVGLGGVVAAVIGGIVFMQWLWTPLQEANRTIKDLDDEVGKRAQQIADLQSEQKRLAKYKVLSLSTNPDQAAAEYTKFLMPVLRSCGLTDILLQGPPPGKLKMPNTQGKKTAGHLPLEFTVRAHGDLGSVVKTLAALRNAPLAHRVKSLSLQPAEASGKDTGKLTVGLALEALIVNKAAPNNPFLSSADVRLVAVESAAALRRAPMGLAVGLALSPWFAAKETIRTDIAMEETAKRKYNDIKYRDLFVGAKPPLEVPVTGPRPDDFDMRQYIKLVQIVSSEKEAYLRNTIVRERDTKLRPKKPGYEYFVVKNEDRDLDLFKGKVLKVDQREMYFQVGADVYAMHIGGSLYDAMRRSLSDDEMETLQLAELYDEDFANEQQKGKAKTKGGPKGGPNIRTKKGKN